MQKLLALRGCQSGEDVTEDKADSCKGEAIKRTLCTKINQLHLMQQIRR